MDCYNFEENITKFIDNELKQDFRKLFIDHKDNCEKCSRKLGNINNNILMFNQLPSLKTSDAFLDRLNQKIYDYNNNPSIWKKIKSFKLFEIPPVYAMGYVAALLLGVFSSYSLINMDTTDYNKINQKVTASLKENSNQASPSKIDENYGIDQSQLADGSNPIQQKMRLQNKKKMAPQNQQISTVSTNYSNGNTNSLNQRRNMPSFNQSSSKKSINNIKNVMTNNDGQNREDYIIDYENKNRYYQKRKDSLKNMLNNNLDRKVIAKIQEQIKKDSIKQLEYYRSFDRIQKTE